MKNRRGRRWTKY